MRTFSLGAGADTVVFGASKTANGVDTITNFTAGDKLNFKAFTSSLKVGDLNVTTGQSLSSADNIYQTTVSGAIKSKDYGEKTNFGELFGTNKPFTTAITSGSKDLIVVKGNDVTQIYYVSDSDSDSTVEDSDVDLVAVISNNGTGVTLTTDNFVVA